MTDTPAGPAPELITCPHCGADVPKGAFCGSCGAHLAEGGTRHRHFSYAAAPQEHVLRSAIITTLFPHLPHRQAHVFREVFAAAIGIVFVLAALRLFAPATLVSVLTLPVLYLLYLYESEVYEDEPVAVLLLTFVAGGALGYLYVVIADHMATASISGTQQGPLVAGVLLPLIAQVLMLAGPLVLLARPKFDETLDGLTFGVASALGFTMVAVITSSWHFFTAPLVNGVATDDIFRVIRSGVLVSLVNAGTTGVITASLWSHLHRHQAARAVPAWRSVPAVVTGAFAIQIGLGISSYYVPALVGLFILWAAAAAVLLVIVRVVLHHGLLEEAHERAVGPLSTCTECRRLVPSMPFCPNCGAARRAAPKHARRLGAQEAR